MSFYLIRVVRFHGAVAAILVVGTFLYLLVDTVKIHLLCVIFLAGAVGGVTNTYMRMRNVPSTAHVIKNTTANTLAIIQVYVSPMIAGVFGVVLYAFFLTDMLSGALFPSFVGQKEEYTGVVDLFSNIGPKEQIDAVKSIAWAFIAGFSERFVPNIIDRMAQEVVHTPHNNSEE